MTPKARAGSFVSGRPQRHAIPPVAIDEQIKQVPTPVWGGDELGTWEMWNSNSIIAWTLARSGIDVEAIDPPPGGPAPGGGKRVRSVSRPVSAYRFDTSRARRRRSRLPAAVGERLWR
jgi:hypothetical protein